MLRAYFFLCAQGLLLMVFKEQYEVPRVKHESVLCKANALPTHYTSSPDPTIRSLLIALFILDTLLSLSKQHLASYLFLNLKINLYKI